MAVDDARGLSEISPEDRLATLPGVRALILTLMICAARPGMVQSAFAS